MKTPKRGLSRKQAVAIEIFLNNRSMSKAKALRLAGYKEAVARQPYKVFGSEAVLAELQKRGYDEIGIRLEPTMITNIHLPEPAPAVPVIDFTQFTPEFLQGLKAKLDKIPDPVVVESSNDLYDFMPHVTSYTPPSSSTWPSCM